jgi:hypothetical protein
MRVPLRRPSAATVISCLALFVALGGTGYAAVSLPRGSVGTAQLRDGAVVSSKVRDGSLAARHFAPGELPSTTLPAGRTLRGAYVLGSSSAAGSQLAVGEISFAFPLQRAPRAHFMAAGIGRPPGGRSRAPLHLRSAQRAGRRASGSRPAHWRDRRHSTAVGRGTLGARDPRRRRLLCRNVGGDGARIADQAEEDSAAAAARPVADPWTAL